MKIRFGLYVLTTIFLILACSKDDDEKIEDIGNIQYKVTFNINWNATDFPVDYPSNSHFSPIIGWSHKPSNTFMQLGTLASAGLKNMAETGNVSPLNTEIIDRINSYEEGYQLYTGSGLNSGVGKIELNIEVNSIHSCISLVSMIAPSPDWYLGIVNVNLYNGIDFVTDTTVVGYVYDSGTDDGITFTSANEISSPQKPIHLITTAPLGNGTSVDTMFCSVKIEKI